MSAHVSSRLYTLDPSPHSFNALQHTIDPLTMEIHYTNVLLLIPKNIAGAIAAENVNTAAPALKIYWIILPNILQKKRNNGRNHYNHELF